MTMTSKAVESGELFFAHVARSNMNAAEIVVYDLKIERQALVRASAEYHRARLDIQSANPPGAALDQALEKLNTDFPMGYRRTELIVVNAAIKEATDTLHRFRARNLKPGAHLDSRRTNLGA